jgi:hypothetical protein
MATTNPEIAAGLIVSLKQTTEGDAHDTPYRRGRRLSGDCGGDLYVAGGAVVTDATPRVEQLILDMEEEPSGKAADAFCRLARTLERENAQLRECLTFWIHDGHLQSFEDRERFRAAARAALEAK